jgi:uncharacterized membrane protein
MALFHFAFDLNHFNLLDPRQNFYRDPLWTVQRMCIVSMFVFVAGLSQAVALEAGQAAPRFWRRWAQIAGCALLVSIGSAVMFPKSWISFGILHAMAAMLILVRGLSGWKSPALVAIALGCIALPQFIEHPFFDSRLTNPVGLVTRLPVTEDYAPVLPWLGVMLLGLVAGRWLLANRRSVIEGAVPSVVRPLAVLGRWSLSFYMLHQPVLIGAIMAFMALMGLR